MFIQVRTVTKARERIEKDGNFSQETEGALMRRARRKRNKNTFLDRGSMVKTAVNVHAAVHGSVAERRKRRKRSKKLRFPFSFELYRRSKIVKRIKKWMEEIRVMWPKRNINIPKPERRVHPKSRK